MLAGARFNDDRAARTLRFTGSRKAGAKAFRGQIHSIRIERATCMIFSHPFRRAKLQLQWGAIFSKPNLSSVCQAIEVVPFDDCHRYLAGALFLTAKTEVTVYLPSTLAGSPFACCARLTFAAAILREWHCFSHPQSSRSAPDKEGFNKNYYPRFIVSQFGSPRRNRFGEQQRWQATGTRAEREQFAIVSLSRVDNK